MNDVFKLIMGFIIDLYSGIYVILCGLLYHCLKSIIIPPSVRPSVHTFVTDVSAFTRTNDFIFGI